MMDANDIIKRVRKIEIKTKGLSKHIFSGEYQSAFKGRGMSFSEVRDYHYGDDVRNIDWNVTARTGSSHVKVFEEERELTVMFLIDISPSSFFGTVNRFKSEINTEICATIAFSAMNNNDKVGAILFSDHIEKYIPPKKGKSHILRIIRELVYHRPDGVKTNLEDALIYLNNVIKKRATCFVLSDFLTDNYESALTIAAKRHDIIGLHVYDEKEEALPNVGLVRVKDAETGNEKIIDTSSKKLREQYNNWFVKHQEYFKDAFTKTGSDTLSIKTDDDYVKSLLKFFKRRGK
jgi:uncharacterized protein (DUF58 family)